MATTSQKLHFQIAVSLFIASVLLYSQSLGNGFVWDAEFAFTRDHTIRDLSSLSLAFTEPTFKHIPTDGENIGLLDYYRPLIKILHILEYQIFSNQPPGYKAVNLVLNGIVVSLFFLFVQFATGNTTVAILASVLYAVNPMRAEAVYWTYADGYLLAALFSLLSLISYQQRRMKLALTCFALGLLSHETAIMLPVIVLLYTWLVEGNKDIRKYAMPTLAFFGVALLYVIVRTLVIGSVPFTQLELLTWLNSVTVMLQRFVKIYFVPDALITLYPDGFFAELTTEVVLSYVVLAGLFGLGILLYSKRRSYLFWYLWFFVWLAVSFNLGEFGSFLMSDKLLYVAAGGFAVLIALAACEFVPRRNYAYVLIGLFAVVHSGIVLAKAPYWRNTRVYLEKALEFTPGFYLAHYTLGYAYIKEKAYDKALEQFSLVVKANPAMSLAHNNMGNIYYLRREYDQAMVSWQRAIETDPQNPMPYFNMGLIQKHRGNYQEALAYFERYLNKVPAADPRVLGQINQLRERLQLDNQPDR